MNKNVNKLLSIFIIFIFFISLLPLNAKAQDIHTMTIDIGPFDDNGPHSETINIEGLESIVGISSDNGNVTYENDNNSINITVSNGTIQGEVLTKDIVVDLPLPDTMTDAVIDNTGYTEKLHYPRNENRFVWNLKEGSKDTYQWGFLKYEELGIIDEARIEINKFKSNPGEYTDSEGYKAKYSDFTEVQVPGYYPRTKPTGYITSTGTEPIKSPIGEPANEHDSSYLGYQLLRYYTYNYTAHITAKGVKQGDDAKYKYKVTIQYTLKDGYTPPEPPPPTPENNPPIALISSPSSAIMGDDVYVHASGSDPDGDTLTSSFDVNPSTGMNGELQDGGNTVWFSKVGYYGISYTVDDGKGGSDTAYTGISILPPIPTVKVNQTGTLKENRKVILDATSSYGGSKRYPVDWSKAVWEIKPVTEGLTEDDIKTLQSYTGTSKLEMLFKKQGQYKVKLTLWNTAGYSNFYEFNLGIKPDLPPVVKLNISKTVVRNPENNNLATIKIEDASYSPDDDKDIIAKRVYLYAFDKDNDGNFDEEQWNVYDNGSWRSIEGTYAEAKNIDIDAINDGNKSSVEIKTNHVGKYKIEEIVREEFGQETIPDFVTISDRRRSNSFNFNEKDKMCEVINTAPIAELKPYIQRNKKADIIVVTDYQGQKLLDLQSKLNILKSELYPVNCNAQYTILSSPVNIGLQKVGSTDYETAYDSRTSRTNSFPSSVYYSSNGYTGYLHKDGSSYVASGSPGDSKTVEAVGYGTSTGYYYWTGKSWGDYVRTSQSNPSSISYNDGEYSGRLGTIVGDGWQEGETTYLSDPSSTRPGTYARTRYRNAHTYSGTVTKPDTRVYGQDYSGTVSRTDYTYYNVNGINFSNLTSSLLRENSDRYVLFISDNSSTDFTQSWGSYFPFGSINKNLLKYISVNNASVYSVAPSSTYDMILNNNYNTDCSIQDVTLRQLVSNSPIEGRLYDTGKYQDALDYIKSKYINNDPFGQYILVNEETMIYDKQYSDYENDPKVTERWRYNHNPKIFENDNGIVDYSGKWIGNSVGVFNKVGEYITTYQAQDDPTREADFENYKLWSKSENQLVIKAHRRPIADFKIYLSDLDSVTAGLGIGDFSYDLDHESESEKGIVARYFKWKKFNDTTWTQGLPPVRINKSDLYIISLTVKDKEGALSYPVTKTLQFSLGIDAFPTYCDWRNTSITPTITVTGSLPLLQQVNYAWTQSTIRPTSGWSISTSSSIPTTQSLEGVWYLHMQALDTDSNIVYRMRGSYKIDLTPPDIDISSNSGSMPWAYNLDLSITDNLSGVKESWFRWSNSNSSIAQLPGFTKLSGSSVTGPSIDGTYYLHVKSFDNAGNIGYKIYGPYKVENLTIVGTVAPNPAMAGERVHFVCNTTGSGEKVIVKMWNNDTVELIPDKSTSNDKNTWRGSYIVPVKTKNNTYPITATVYKNSNSRSCPLSLTIKGNIYDLLKPEIKNGN